MLFEQGLESTLQARLATVNRARACKFFLFTTFQTQAHEHFVEIDFSYDWILPRLDDDLCAAIFRLFGSTGQCK